MNSAAAKEISMIAKAAYMVNERVDGKFSVPPQRWSVRVSEGGSTGRTTNPRWRCTTQRMAPLRELRW